MSVKQYMTCNTRLPSLTKPAKYAAQIPKLARAAGVTRQSIHAMRTGQMKMSAELAAIFATIAGENPHFAIERVMIENAKPDMATRLQKSFFFDLGLWRWRRLCLLQPQTTLPRHMPQLRPHLNVHHVTRFSAVNAVYIVAHQPTHTARRGRNPCPYACTVPTLIARRLSLAIPQ